jgi:hypothetical protein
VRRSRGSAEHNRTSAYVSIRQHTSAYVSIHTPAYASGGDQEAVLSATCRCQVIVLCLPTVSASAYIRQHTSAGQAVLSATCRCQGIVLCLPTVSASAYVSIHTPAYVSRSGSAERNMQVSRHCIVFHNCFTSNKKYQKLKTRNIHEHHFNLLASSLRPHTLEAKGPIH